MPQSLAKTLIHTVFSTKNRTPFLRHLNFRDEVHRYLGGVLNNLSCQPIIVGGVEDRIHTLYALSRTATVADTIKEMKRASSVWIKERAPDLADFSWQNGYGAFSIGYSQIEDVRRYIANQEQHHRKHSFQEEFRMLLARYEIPFDEKYVWD